MKKFLLLFLAFLSVTSVVKPNDFHSRLDLSDELKQGLEAGIIIGMLPPVASQTASAPYAYCSWVKNRTSEEKQRDALAGVISAGASLTVWGSMYYAGYKYFGSDHPRLSTAFAIAGGVDIGSRILLSMLMS